MLQYIDNSTQVWQICNPNQYSEDLELSSILNLDFKYWYVGNLAGSSIISFNFKLQSNHKIEENNLVYNSVLFSKTIFILFDTW